MKITHLSELKFTNDLIYYQWSRYCTIFQGIIRFIRQSSS